MKKITIKVLAEDIITSRYTDPDDCAIARAVKRSVPHLDVSIGPWAVHIEKTYYPLSKEIRDKINGMYKSLGVYHQDDEDTASIKPEDFEFELTIEEHAEFH